MPLPGTGARLFQRTASRFSRGGPAKRYAGPTARKTGKKPASKPRGLTLEDFSSTRSPPAADVCSQLWLFLATMMESRQLLSQRQEKEEGSAMVPLGSLVSVHLLQVSALYTHGSMVYVFKLWTKCMNFFHHALNMRISFTVCSLNKQLQNLH